MFEYWLFYLTMGAIGFMFCYFYRFFIIIAVPVIGWIIVSDFSRFYRFNVKPGERYIFLVAISMLIALSMSALGAYENWKKQIDG